MVSKGRVTNVTPPPGTTVFLIGMRVNKPWRLHEWAAVFLAMPRMLRHLATRSDSGLITYDLYLGRVMLLVSYWSSPEALRDFASAPKAPHLSAWQWFSRRLAGTGSVGVWHETYVIGEHETIYSDMPAFGLGKAVGSAPVGQGSATARQRLGAS